MHTVPVKGAKFLLCGFKAEACGKSLLCELFSDDLCNMLCGKAEFLQQIHSRAGVAVHIVDADARDRRRAMLGKCGGDRFAETADDVVLFNRDDTAGLLCGSNNKLFIERLDGMDIDDFNADAFFFQCIAALTASCTMRPVATTVMSVPSRSVMPLPSSNL